MKRIGFMLVGVLAFGIQAQSATSRDDITHIIDFARVLSPYNQGEWKFCEPGMYVKSVSIWANATPLSVDSKTITFLHFDCSSPEFDKDNVDFEKTSSFSFYSGNLNADDYESASKDCPQNIFPAKTQSHVVAFSPGYGRFVKDGYVYWSGYSALRMTCNDTSRNVLEVKSPTPGKVDWDSGYICRDDSAVCGVSLFIGEATATYDEAISGISVACCKK